MVVRIKTQSYGQGGKQAREQPLLPTIIGPAIIARPAITVAVRIRVAAI